MQALLNEKETELWLEGKAEAEVVHETLKQSCKDTQRVVRALERVRKAVKKGCGCHHDGTRNSCLGCVLYEDVEEHDSDAAWLMCASYRKL